MTRLCNHLRQVRFLVKRLQSQIKSFGASKSRDLFRLAKIGQCYIFMREIGLIFMKLNYLGTMNFNNKISNDHVNTEALPAVWDLLSTSRGIDPVIVIKT